jgi:ATP-dependent helicase/nuclease subunit B
MHEEIFRALARGATLITVNARMAGVLAREFHTRQKEAGRKLWRPPDVLPLDGFLNRRWKDCVWRGAADGLTLLTPLQEQLLWEQIIRRSPAGETLLRIPETACSAADTWRLVQAYGLPVDARFEVAEDCAAFAGWTRDFEKRCRANRWIEQARLSDFIAKGDVARRETLYIAGFEEITPQQAHLFAALGEPIVVEAPRQNSELRFSKFADAQSEIRAAAAWARGLLEENGETEIGIVVPDLPRLRTKIERLFQDLGEQSFHISLGGPLAEEPMIHSALLVLEFGLGTLPLPSAGVLLRSPFVGGYEREFTRRGLIDAHLRKSGVWDVEPSRLADESSASPELARRLAKFDQLRERLPAEQRPSEWCRDFARLLDTLGWPGDRVLSNREPQIVEAWRALLSDLAALDLGTARFTYDQALSRLREIAAAKTFQVEDRGAPVQIMGLLEASGLRFDQLWVMGLHDEALPFPARPNPFLPGSLQREHKLPHSSAEREMHFAKKLIDGLLASAPDVVVSYPASDQDRRFSPCGLVSGPWETPVRVPAAREARAPMEEFADAVAPPVSIESEQRGGASLFKDIAACPFRAFAKYRLFARPLEESMPGLSYRDRGNTVHRALQVIWSELGSHVRLYEMGEGELEELISRAARAGAGRIPHSIGRRLEQQRLGKLLRDWLEIEKSRAPFFVRAIEADRLVNIGGLEVKTRADRVDQLPSGREVILDYKTGQLNSKAWDSDRPDEPQLPLYCATSEHPIAGAAFVQIRVGELGFQGLMEPGSALPHIKRMRMDEPTLEEEIRRWRDVLERLAERFRGGDATVDPKHGACDHCGLWGLCRIRESQNAG